MSFSLSLFLFYHPYRIPYLFYFFLFLFISFYDSFYVFYYALASGSRAPIPWGAETAKPRRIAASQIQSLASLLIFSF